MLDRRLYITLFLTIMLTAFGASMVVPLLPVFGQTLGATGLELGLIFSAFALARSIFLPMVGNLADSWGRRNFMVWGLAIYIVVAIGFAQSRSVLHLVLCRFVLGAAAAAVVPLARAYVGDMTGPGEEGRMMGHFNMAFFGGLAAGPWVGGFMKDQFGIDSAFYSMGIFSLLAFLLCLKFLPQAGRIQYDGGPPRESLFSLLHIPEVAAMFLFRFGSILGMGVNWSFMPLYGHDVLHLSGSKIGILVSMTVLMTTLLQPYFGRLADRVNRPGMTVLGGVLASLCLLALPYCRTFYHLLAVNTLMGTAIGAYMPPLMAMAVNVGRRTNMMTRIMSILELAFSMGMVVGPLLAGLIKQVYGLQTIFWFGGIMGLTTCIAFLVVSIKKGLK